MARDNNPSNQSELVFQTERAAALGEVTATPDYIIQRYRRCSLWRLFPKELMFKYLHDIGISEKEFLDFGCGEGVITTQLAKLGGRVSGVDVAPELIACAERRAQLDQVQERVRFTVGELPKAGVTGKPFDVLVCHAALHHVELDAVPPLIERLKPGGLAIMVEPVCFSRLLHQVRGLVPVKNEASPDERQLNRQEIDYLIRLLENPQATYFNLLGRLTRFLPNSNKIDRGHWLTKVTVIILLSLDRLLLTVAPFLSRFCGSIVIVGRRPTHGVSTGHNCAP